MPWRGPEHDGDFPSLGWEIAEWMEEYLRVPSGRLYGQPFVLTDEQLGFLVRMYALDARGRRVYRRFSKRGPKGCGKSPFAGAWLLAEFCGPVRFDGWDAAGEPVGRRWDSPLCQVIGFAEEQTDNLWLGTREMAAGSALVDEMGVTLGFGKISFDTGEPGLMEPVSSSASAREGALTTAAALEETHLWFGQRGAYNKLAAVTRRNVAKTGGTTFEVTNAPALGEGSVAEQTLAAANKGQAGLLYESIEGVLVDDPKDPDNRDAVMESLRLAYGEANAELGGWVDLERIYEETLDVDVSTSDVARFYFNVAVKSESKAFAPAEIAKTIAGTEPEPGEPIVLAFDGAYTRDCAVLSAWTLGEEETAEDGSTVVLEPPHHFLVRAWERPPDLRNEHHYEHPRIEIDATARETVETYDVVVFAYDSAFRQLSSMYDDWIEEHGEVDKDHPTKRRAKGIMLGFPTNKGARMDPALKRLQEDLREGLFTHDGDPLVVKHLENALVERRGQYRYLSKPSGLGNHIDAAVTMTFGYDLVPMARRILSERPPRFTRPLVAVR